MGMNDRATGERAPIAAALHSRTATLRSWLWAGVAAGSLAGCGGTGAGTGGSAQGSAPPATPTSGSLTLLVRDVVETPIPGASVTVRTATYERQGVTASTGSVTLPDVPIGRVTVAVRAAGFEPVEYGTILRGAQDSWSISLEAEGAWALGRPVVLDARVLDRAADGTTLRMGADIAVLGGNSEPLLSLTAADFSFVDIDCAWVGPRGCASDANGKVTAQNNGQVSSDGGILFSGLQPSGARRPYVVGILLERSEDMRDWDFRVAALRRYLSDVGANDLVGVATVESSDGGSNVSMLGPYTRDGRVHQQALDRLGPPAGRPPALLGSVEDMIRRTAEARDQLSRGANAIVLVVAEDYSIFAGLSEQAAALARRSNVRVSAIEWSNAGLSEIVARSGGFTGEVYDRRQFEMFFGAMDRLLGGALPFYRIEMRVKGGAGTFVAGGNLRAFVGVRIPARIPARMAITGFDVAIP